MKILLLHPGGLGDIILSLPAIALLRERFPAARFTLAANIDHVAPIVGGYVESAMSLSTLPLHSLYTDEPAPQPEVRFWNSFDRIVSWTGSGDARFAGNLKKIHPKACVASWKPGPRESRHVSQLFVDSLGPEVAAGRTAVPPSIVLNPELSGRGRQWLIRRNWNGAASIVALHPGAGSRAKRWPLIRFIGLARHIVFKEKKKILLIEGPAESGLAAQVARELPKGEAFLADSLPLDTVAAVILQSRLFVGSDSGIAHLAAALRVPSIVIFGPTSPRHWAPPGGHVTVLMNSEGCKGCGSGENEHTCLENITVDNVIRTTRERGRPARIALYQSPGEW